MAGSAIGPDSAALKVGYRSSAILDGPGDVAVALTSAETDDHDESWSLFLRLSLNNGKDRSSLPHYAVTNVTPLKRS